MQVVTLPLIFRIEQFRHSAVLTSAHGAEVNLHYENEQDALLAIAKLGKAVRDYWAAVNTRLVASDV